MGAAISLKRKIFSDTTYTWTNNKWEARYKVRCRYFWNILLLCKQDIVNINFRLDVMHCSKKNMVTTIYRQSSFHFLLSNLYANKKMLNL